jgi:hypothetical protein
MGDVHFEGGRVSAIVELRNDSDAPLSILGFTVPWHYREALRFSAPGYEDARAVVDPADEPDLVLAPGTTDRGDVDVTHRLRDAGGRYLEDGAGTYEIEARARLVVDAAAREGTAPRREIEATCGFPLTIEPASGERGRAHAAALAAAAAGGYDVAEHRLTGVEESEGRLFFVFEHVFPAPPGGHFGVWVAADGTTQLVHGE